METIAEKLKHCYVTERFYFVRFRLKSNTNIIRLVLKASALILLRFKQFSLLL